MTTRASRSLRARLLAGLFAWILATLLATGFVLQALFQAEVERRFDAELATHLDQLLAGLRPDAEGRLALSRPMADPRFDLPYSALYWQVDGPAGASLRSRSLWDGTLPLRADEPQDGELHRHVLPGPLGQHLVALERRVTLPGSEGVVRAAVAGDLGEVEAATSQFTRISALFLGTLALSLGVAAFVLVHGTVRPLGRLQRSLASVRLGRAPRVEGVYPTEIQPLVDDLNGLLAHNATILDRARTEAGNLAHQLKTPLAIVANAARTLPQDERSATILEQADLLGRRIDHALTKARAATTGALLGATTTAGPQLHRLANAMRTLHGPNDIEVELHDRSSRAVQIEPRDFDELVGNLLDNACKWARTQVTLTTTEDAGTLRIVVEDDGPGLPASRRAEVFERGRKLDERAAGAGLGLAIVQDLVSAYGGRILLDDSPLGGLRASLVLPLAGAER